MTIQGHSPSPLRFPRGTAAALLALLAAGLAPAAALAQGAPGATTVGPCTTRVLEEPARRAFACTGGLVFEAEAAASLGITLSGEDAPLEEIGLRSGAAWIEDAPAPGHTFQIRTPHAIASVRGTVWAVDVDSGATAVFVAEGQVAVAHADAPSRPVLLGPGEGVDVVPGAPLEVKTWGAARVAALMERFGR
ncbi:FecR family protein [Oceanicella sp. SM1341]|uniref:FecR family protein n=1 Tax=Oceanicella sp. SM1341 TaxID=1548889 RepID=UPI000E5537ED|nr:FecR family protein [Oceanicella sp. SM1341]